MATIEDFGTQGEPPTHPELLDYLAVEFMRSGWSMKHVHRLIVTSNTYRQSSRVTPEILARDPDNRLLARGPRVRLSAETIRDNALAAAGPVDAPHGRAAGLSAAAGQHLAARGPQCAEVRDRRGRGPLPPRRLRLLASQRAVPQFYELRRARPRASCVVGRPRTNTPLQALTLLNDPAYVEMARALAVRIATDHSEMTIDGKIEYGFRRVLSRAPSGREAKLLEGVYRRELARFEADPAAAKSLAAGARAGRLRRRVRRLVLRGQHPVEPG